MSRWLATGRNSQAYEPHPEGRAGEEEICQKRRYQRELPQSTILQVEPLGFGLEAEVSKILSRGV